MPVRAPRPPRRLGAAVALGLAALASGCGSSAVAELPPPAGPRQAPPPRERPAGRVVALADAPPAIARRLAHPAIRVDVEPAPRQALLRGQARSVELTAAAGLPREEAGAGVGPAQMVARGSLLWVTDTRGDALLVFRTRPDLELVRRVWLPGGPYAIALDEDKFRLWVTLTGTNEVVEFPAHGRPHELRRFPTVRQPDAVAVDSATHRVHVAGRGGQLQLLDPPPLR
jgi:hypothetical protein